MPRCKHCLEPVPFEDLAEHEDKCFYNCENVETDAVEDGELYGDSVGY